MVSNNAFAALYGFYAKSEVDVLIDGYSFVRLCERVLESGGPMRNWPTILAATMAAIGGSAVQ